eukprot:6810219-Prymnesium_polylepis.1
MSEGKCSAPETPAAQQQPTNHEQVGDTVRVGGTDFAENANTLRTRGIELANGGHLKAALPLFLAAAAVSPLDPQTHSDEGVTWMRMNEWEQSWGAFKRALTINPNFQVALDNREELKSFLRSAPDGGGIIARDRARPPFRGSRKREHTVLPIARLSAVPTEDGWWTRPFILPELRGKSRRERAANASKLEDALRAAFPDGRAEYYPGGMVHSGVKPTFLPLGDALTRVLPARSNPRRSGSLAASRGSSLAASRGSSLAAKPWQQPGRKT